ncbi:MAG: amidohydrolase family protein [Saprospiraceae bacterium]
MKKHPTLLVVFTLLVFPSLFWAQGSSSEDLKPVTRTYAFTKATIITQPGQVIENGTVIIKNGLIQAVGKNVAIPMDAEIIKADSMYIYAGFIEGLSHTGIPRAEAPQPGAGRGGGGNRQQTPEVANPGTPPNKLAGITPERKLTEVLSASDKSIEEMRKMGFTAAHVVPEGMMLPGQGAVILLHGDNPDAMVLKDGTAFFSQFTGARRMYPSTVIAVIAKWRELYHQAELAQAHEKAYKANPKGMSRPAYDPVLQAFYPVINKNQKVFFKASDVKSAYRVLSLQKEFGFPVVMAELKQGWHVADELSKKNIPVLLSMDLPEAKEEKGEEATAKGSERGGRPGGGVAGRGRGPEDAVATPAASTPKPAKADPNDPFQKEKVALEKRRNEEMKKHLEQAASLEKAGVVFGFSTLDVKSKDIQTNLRKMIENGLSENTALAALTTIPAKMLGVSDMIGSIEQGKIANLVITDKPYFAEKSNVRYVIVDGVKYEYEAKKPAKKGDPNAKVKVAGKWSYRFEAMGQTMSGTLDLSDVSGTISGSISNETMGNKSTIESAELNGNALSFTTQIDAGGQNLTVAYALVIDGDSIEGTVTAGQYGSFSLEGERISNPD